MEVKNLNSFRAVRSAIAYELERQVNLIDAGGTVEQVNMGWDEERQRTVVQRSKEDAHDYRYFPDPDLPPSWSAGRKWPASPPPCRSCPRPSAIAISRIGACGAVEADTLSGESLVAAFFEEAVAAYGTGDGKPQRLATWMTGELFRLLYADGEGQDLRQIGEVKIKPADFAALLKLVDEKVINPNTGKRCWRACTPPAKPPRPSSSAKA